MKHMGMGMKGFGAKGVASKGFFGFIGGFFKLLFFGVFFIVFIVIGMFLFLAMRKKLQNQNFQVKDNFNSTKNSDDIIDVEIVDNHPVKR